MVDQNEDLHQQLRSQLERVGLTWDSLPADRDTWHAVLEVVHATYAEADEDRHSNERSLQVSSEELGELVERLQEERDKMRAVVSDGLIHVDQATRILTLNAEAERLLRTTEDDVRMRRLFADLQLDGRTGSEYLEVDPTAVERMVADGTHLVLSDCILHLPDRPPAAVSFSLNPIHRSGQALGAMIVLRDISRAKQAEERLRRTNESLARANEQAQDAMRALEAARDSAQNAAEAKGMFLATMSHEIRTPMNGILGAIELLRNDHSLDADQRDYLDTAHGSAQSLLAIIDDILDFSKIEAGKMHIESVPTVIGDLLEDVASLHAPTAQAKSVVLHCELGVDLPRQLAIDPVRLRQVVGNILSNGVKFTERGSVRMSSSWTDELGEGRDGWLEVAIEDTGTGIPREMQETIFHSFQQADGATTRRFGGTGLGLSISRHLTELMGGSISVQSQVGRGSIFTVRLPARVVDRAPLFDAEALHGLEIECLIDELETRRLVGEYLTRCGAQVLDFDGDADPVGVRRERVVLVSRGLQQSVPDSLPKLVLGAPADPAESQSPERSWVALPPSRRQLVRRLRALRDDRRQEAEASPVTAPSTLSGHVLLVEDNLINQKIATAMLRRLGITFEIANNGEEAVEARRERSFDAVLMDCQMPVMDGFDATRGMRNLERDLPSPRVPIIAMTANAMEGDRERCLDAGMDDYLSKPVDQASLGSMLDRWLNAEGGDVSVAGEPSWSAGAHPQASDPAR